MPVLVVCFTQSKVHNTGTGAGWIAKHAGANLFELEPAAPNPEPYGETLKAVERDAAGGTLPTLKAIPSLDGYDIRRRCPPHRRRHHRLARPPLRSLTLLR